MAAARTDFIDKPSEVLVNSLKHKGMHEALPEKFLRLALTSYRQDLQAILKFLKVTGCYCCCYVI